MARRQDQQRAIGLRRQGKTYSEIRAELQVAKSTLSDWLRKLPLTDEQLNQLELKIQYKKQVAIEKTRIVKQKKYDERLVSTYNNEKKHWGLLTERELEIAGMFLYWGEGSKRLKGSVNISNTDPKVIKFALYWLTHSLEIPRIKVRVALQLYSDMDIQQAMEFWHRELNLPLSQFIKPYVKESKRVNIEHKGFGYGTCGLIVYDTSLKEKIIMGINAIADIYDPEFTPSL